MKNRKMKWILLILICILAAGSIYFALNKPKKSVTWDIKVREHWNNPAAGRRMHEKRVLFIDSDKEIGKITYLDENNKSKETKQFKIKKEDINKILELAEKGESTIDRKENDVYTIYEIVIKSNISYVDSKLDTNNVISNLFIDEDL